MTKEPRRPKAERSLKGEDELSQRGTDHFWLSKVYPDAAESFLHRQKAVDEIKSECLVVLDANVLLMPYRLGAQSLDEVNKVYQGLADGKRLVVPGQAAREFLKNRAMRLRDVARELNNQASLIQVPMEKSVGFLENDGNFKDLQKLADDIKKLKGKVLQKTRELSTRLKSDVGSDPVSEAYRVILKDAVVDLPLDEDAEKQLIEEMRWRFAHDIPPGYRDDDKLDEGIGDLLIWKTILKVASEKNADSIFVTEDAKSDWWVRSEGTFQPRIELIEEYRHCTGGRTIHLVPLSDLLSIFGAKSDAVDDTKRAEATPRRTTIKADSAQPTPVFVHEPDEELDQLNLTSLMELNASLMERARQKAQEHQRLKRQTQDLHAIRRLDDSEISALFHRIDDAWSEFAYLNRRQKEVERRIQALVRG